MKKITLLFAICFALQFNGFAQCPGLPTPGFTCVPNADFETFLITFTSITGPLDGEISNVEAAAVTGTLNLGGVAPYNAINNFTGLEALTGITGLEITYNTAVSSIDVSLNSSLSVLNTEGSTALISIITGTNAALSELRIPGVSASAINVSGNPSLTLVDARFTGLVNLDLSSNGNLVSLQCRDSALTSLDMRNGNNANVTLFNSDFNGSLLCIFVDDKTAGYLTSLPWAKDLSSTFVNNEGECNTLTVESENKITFNLYPNPAKNSVNVTTSLQESQMLIYDITGKLVLKKQLLFGNNTVDVSAISSGVYLAKIVSNSKSLTKKLIIQ